MSAMAIVVLGVTKINSRRTKYLRDILSPELLYSLGNIVKVNIVSLFYDREYMFAEHIVCYFALPFINQVVTD